MSKERDAFIESIGEQLKGQMPSEEEIEKGEVADAYYKNLRGGDIVKHVTKTVALYTRNVLPLLSLEQAMELCSMVHTLIATVLIYLVEDGLIKKE